MILYNTLMGVCAGALILLLRSAVRQHVKFVITDTSPDLTFRRYAPAFLGFGIPLTLLSLHMALTWPLTANPPINIIFSEPSLMLGVMSVIAGILSLTVTEKTFNIHYVIRVTQIVGLVLLACAAAILRFNLVGDAPKLEPITGQVHGWENTFFALLYLAAAIGALVSAWVTSHWAYVTQRVAWLIAGVGFLGFSILNYYTHVGLLVNIQRGTNYLW